MTPIKKIVIVGGGTAGWLTACVIAARHKGRGASGFKVTLIESPNVPTIGVGEGTWPTMRGTLCRIGVSETELFRQCDASFKQGAVFSRWTTGEANDAYFHPLMLPQGFSQMNLAPHWLHDGRGQTFCDAVCPQATIASSGLAPKTIATAEFEAIANYAYHLDAGKFSAFLQSHACQELSVEHLLAEVTQVKTKGNGDIESLVLDHSRAIEGDLFIDCTGFKALLIGETMGVGFKDCKHTLFCDTALAVQVPYENDLSPIASHTISTAQSSGWIWDIGLPTRRGTGYVYSSHHISESDAERELLDYLGKESSHQSIRKIAIRSGHRETFWKGNCVAVGMSAGFLEPLEASAIVMVELSAKLIAEQLPVCREVMDIVAARFNSTTLYRWGRIIDFLKLHYVLTKRQDTDFWRDNLSPESIPDRLQNLLLLWSYQSPWFHDEFNQVEEVFPAASYQYVLYGMQFKTMIENDALEPHMAKANRLFQENRTITQKLRASLPYHRDLIQKIVRHGMQPV